MLFNKQRNRRIFFYILIALLFIPVSYFAGTGIIHLLNVNELLTVHKIHPGVLGILAVLFLFIIPQGIFYLLTLKKVNHYFPITNDNIRNHRQLYLLYIDEEIMYFQRAIDLLHHLGGNSVDHKSFTGTLTSFQEIRILVKDGADLQDEQLVCLNEVFNKKYWLKKLK